MALSNEDKKDVAGAFGKKAASAVSKATRDKSYVPTNSNADLIRTARKTRDKGTLGSYGTKWLASASRENSSKSKALKSKTGSFDKMNAERKNQGYKPKTDGATKGMYDFFDKYD